MMHSQIKSNHIQCYCERGATALKIWFEMKMTVALSASMLTLSCSHAGSSLLKALKLLLPALIPSWRFFDTIAPSPRIEFTLLKTAQDMPDSWHEFRPRPRHLPMRAMVNRMFWNPRWNETLFLVSCAERLMENGAEHSTREIVKRIKTELGQSGVNGIALPYLQFRLTVVSRQGAGLQKVIAFISPVYPLFGNTFS